MSEGYVGVDFDGTLAHYESWDGPGVLGSPVEVMCDRVRRWLAEGREVKIFTARVSSEYADVERSAIERWCEEQFGRPLEVTCVKDYRMEEFWDDSAVQVERNSGLRVDGKEEFFEPGDIGAVM